jgi:hypothetical protein
MASSAWDKTKLSYHILVDLLSVAIFGMIVFLLPENRLEAIIVLTGATIYQAIKVGDACILQNQTLQATSLLTALRVILPHIKDTYTKEQWEKQEESFERELPYTDVAYADKYAPHWKGRMRPWALRLTLDEQWYELLPSLKIKSAVLTSTGLGWGCRSLMLLVRVVMLSGWTPGQFGWRF